MKLNKTFYSIPDRVLNYFMFRFTYAFYYVLENLIQFNHLLRFTFVVIGFRDVFNIKYLCIKDMHIVQYEKSWISYSEILFWCHCMPHTFMYIYKHYMYLLIIMICLWYFVFYSSLFYAGNVCTYNIPLYELL